jgi:hypothetical protein
MKQVVGSWSKSRSKAYIRLSLFFFVSLFFWLSQLILRSSTKQRVWSFPASFAWISHEWRSFRSSSNLVWLSLDSQQSMHRRGDVHVCCHDSLRDLAHFSQPNILLAIPLSVLQTHCTIAFTHTPKKKFPPAGCNTPLCNPSTQQYCFSRESQLRSCSFTSLFSNEDVSQSIGHTSRAQGFHSCKSTHNSNYTVVSWNCIFFLIHFCRHLSLFFRSHEITCTIHVKLSFLCVQPSARSCIIYQRGGSARL